MDTDSSTILERPSEVERRPVRALFIAAHPVQYASPIFQLLARDPRIEIQVAYCSLRGAETHVDPDFGVEVKWDVPLLEGYPWQHMRSWPAQPGRRSFLGLTNPDVWSLIRKGHFDVVVMYTGYLCATFWIAMLAAKMSRTSVVFGTDASDLAPRDGNKWKIRVKKMLWPGLFNLADTVIVPSSAGVAMMRQLGIPAEKIVLTPYSVNNPWWIAKSRAVDRRAVRARWNIPEDSAVVLFSAKLQPWKRPLDLLRAFAKLTTGDSYLVFAGDGPLRETLEAEARILGVAERVRFLGFVNQSVLPETYSASDILVLPSDYEPFGVVVNEAMLCACCVIASDRVGAGPDLIRNGETGFVFPAGDVDRLATLLNSIVGAPDVYKRMGNAARSRMESWSPELNVEKTIAAIQGAMRGHL